MWLRIASLLIPLVALAAACGGSNGGTPTPSPQEVMVRITAQDRLFDEQSITVPANSRVTVELGNQDADPHNIAVYETRAAEQEIFVSDTIAGRGTTTSGSFHAPPPGKYFFRCDVHPVTMTGELIVEWR